MNEDGRDWEKQGADKPKFMEQLLSEPPSQESGQAAGEAFGQGQGGPDEWAGMGVALRGLAPQVDDDGGPAAQAAENSPPAAMFVLVTYDQEDDRRHRRQPSAGDDDPEPSIHRAAQELGRRGGLKSAVGRRLRQKLHKPEMPPVSTGSGLRQRRKRPWWFKPSRLPGMRI